MFPYKPCYGAKVWHSNSKYRRVVYRCNGRSRGTAACATPHVDEGMVKQAFVRAVNTVLTDTDEIFAGLAEMFRAEAAAEFVCKLAERDMPVARFDRGMWCGLLDSVSVHNLTDARFTFKDGTQRTCPLY